MKKTILSIIACNLLGCVYAQVTEDQIDQYINGIEFPISGWQFEAETHFTDTTGIYDTILKKRFARWQRKHSGRLNYTGAPANATAEDLAAFLTANNLNNVHCTTGGTNPWQLLGPVSTPDRRQIAGLFGCVAVHPQNKNIVYAGAEISGLWKGVRSATDNEFHWSRITVDNSKAALGVTAIEIVPGNTPGVDDEILIGTYRRWLESGYGIYRSTNSGASWTKVTMKSAFPPGSGSLIDNAQIINIKRSPNNSNILYACGSDRIWYSADGGLNWGLIKDEVPTGQWHTFTFTDIEFSLKAGVDVAFISGNNWNQVNNHPAHIYKFTGFNSSSYGTITNMDLSGMGNATSPLKLRPVCIAVSPADPDYFYFLAQTSTHGKSVYKLHYNATSWGAPIAQGTTPGRGGAVMGSSPVFELSERPLTAGQSNISHMYVGGLEMHRTVDGGNTWIKATQYNPYHGSIDFSTHADIRGASYFGFAQGEDIIFMANDGGIGVSESSGVNGTWENINDHDLNSLDSEMPGVSYKTDRIIVGAWHNGLQYRDDGNWNSVYLADNGEVITNNLSDNAQSGYLVAYGYVQKLSNASEGSVAPGPVIVGQSNTKVLRPLMQLDPQDPEAVYVSGLGLFHRDNSGLQNIYDQPNVSIKRRISAFRVSADNSTAYLAHESGHGGAGNPLTNHKVYKLDLTVDPVSITNITANLNNFNNAFPNSDATPTWLSWHHINDFAIDPNDPDIVFACFSDYATPSEPGRVIYTIDGGINWKEFSGTNLPLIPINRLLIRGGREIYAATDQGVYKIEFTKTYDGNGNVTAIAGQGWQCFNNNLPNAVVNSLVLNTCEDELYASTWGYGVYKTLLEPLSTPATPQNITSSQTWSGTKEITENLVIQNGATLTVQGKVLMHGKGNSIEIQPGGRLIIDGGTITTNCQSWSGIWIKGNSSLAQTPANQGVLEIINGGKISYADQAVTNSAIPSNGDWVVWGTQGGIIEATDAEFYNNGRDVAFYSYDHPSNNGVYKAEFDNCTFTRDDNFRHVTMIQHITMLSVEGVKIRGCTFENDNTTAQFKHGGGGIFALNATFTIDKLGTDKTTFNDYRDAIRAKNALCAQTTNPIEINNTVFNRNHHSIYLAEAQFAKVSHNTVNVPNTQGLSSWPPVFQPVRYGIYMDGCQDFRLYENALATDGFNSSINSIGMVIKNSGPVATEVYRNIIDGFTIGVEAIGRNRDAGSTDVGLTFKCHDLGYNYGNATDVFVAQAAAHPENGIQVFQGENFAGSQATDLPNNLFTPGGPVFVSNFNNQEQSQVVYYYGQGDPRLDPKQAIGILDFQTPHTVTLSTVCPVKPAAPPGDINGINQGLTQAESDLTANLNLRTQYVDDGATPQLEAQILIADDQQEYQDLYIDMMNIAPYVSDENLLNLANNYEFPELALRNIMVANPHSARNPEIMEALYNREPALSQQTLNDIEAGEQTITAMDVLEMKIADAQGRSEAATLDFMEYHRGQGGDYEAILLTHLKTRDEAHFRYAVVDAYIRRGDKVSAQTEFNKIVPECEMSDPEMNDHGYLQNFYNVVFEIMDNAEQNISELNASQQAVLQGIVDNGTGPAVGRARYVLEMNGVSSEYFEPVYLPGGSAKKASDPQPDRPAIPASHFTLSPNPANGHIILQWKWMEAGLMEPFQIHVYDLKGSLLMKEEVKTVEENIRLLSLNGLSPGAYLMKVIHKGEIPFREKFIIQ